MTIYIDNHDFHYEIENLCRLFFQNEKIVVLKESNILEDEETYVYTKVNNLEDKKQLIVKIKYDGKIVDKRDFVDNLGEDIDLECERKFSVMIFETFCELTNVRPPWGILTGIRPVKLLRRLIEKDGLDNTLKYFKEGLLVSDEKLDLCLETMNKEKGILELSGPSSFSLYISIPFCPTRCSYCSFVSQSIEKAKDLIPPYVDLLCDEVKYTGEIVKKLKLKLETVYIGGGTPTTLNCDQLDKLIKTIKENFNMQECREFTVEAGRPDTITDEKLKLLKSMGVDRISINPQTLNDNVLERIGRKHTALQTIEAFNMVRKYGFENVNMDLIAGLPDDTYDSFVNTLDEICKLNPENITIHTLSMKKSSNLTSQGKKINAQESNEAAKMLNYASKKLKSHKYEPYYLYRQSRMVGNFENVGWSKHSYEGLYNIYIMDETHTILACGAGAVSKIKDPNSKKIDRIFNYKFPYEYVNLFPDIIKRKEQVELLYERFQ